MKTISKSFIKNTDGSVCTFPYNPNDNYYSYVQNYINQGYHQCIFTSDILMAMADLIIKDHHGNVSEIELLEDDVDLSCKINSLVKKANHNKAFWADIQKTIDFLSDSESIDISKIELCGEKDGYYRIVLHMNGIAEIEGDPQGYFLKTLETIMEAHV